MLSLPTGKQRDFIDRSQARLNIAHGSVRSSKTVGTSIRWIEYLLDRPPGNLLMVGKTLTALHRNVLSDIQKWVGADACQIRLSSKEARIYGRTIWLEGANDERSFEKIQGETLAGVYGDEVSTWPRSFTDMLLSRLSETGARAFFTTNPGPPQHYLKKNFIDREADLGSDHIRCWKFRLEDNPHLDPLYVEQLKREYTGLWYQRYILGNWVAAEGAVFQNFDISRHVIKTLPDGKASQLRIGVDYGSSNPTAFIKALRYGDKWVIAGEYYHRPREQRQKTNSEYAADLSKFIGDLHPSSVEIDPSAASFILEARRARVSQVHSADNTVLDGIRRIANALEKGQLVIHESCTNLIEEIQGYSWDSKAQERGEDKPLKQDDHSVDALRYIANVIYK
jgi:PBSX family phage terminase large subunit